MRPSGPATGDPLHARTADTETCAGPWLGQRQILGRWRPPRPRGPVDRWQMRETCRGTYCATSGQARSPQQARYAHQPGGRCFRGTRGFHASRENAPECSRQTPGSSRTISPAQSVRTKTSRRPQPIHFLDRRRLRDPPRFTHQLDVRLWSVKPPTTDSTRTSRKSVRCHKQAFRGPVPSDTSVSVMSWRVIAPTVTRWVVFQCFDLFFLPLSSCNR
jgi:hypothetical protein